MKSIKLAAAALGAIAFAGAAFAQQSQSKPNMSASVENQKIMTDCMAMSHEMMMKDAKCTTMMKDMKMSDADMAKMASCNKMSKDAMMADKECVAMTKMHGDMMKMAAPH